MRIAIIGLGVMGKNHYRVLKSINTVEVVALCDAIDQSSNFSEPFFTDINAMCDSIEFDAAILAVPTPLHLETAKLLIERGIDFLLEKPIASNAKDGEEILSLAKAKGVKVAIGHVERFNPVVNALKKELVGKEIYSISITRVGPFPPRIGDVGILTDLSVHDIDLVRYLSAQEFVDMHILKSKKIHNHSEDNAELTFQLQNGTVGNITTNWLTPFKRRKIEVACKEAYYEADLMSQELMEYSSYQTNSSYLSRWCFVQKGEPLRNELKAFIEYVKNGNIGDLASFEDSIKTLEIIEKYNK